MTDGLWIVTGASRGIGQAIARELADPSRPLLLTATEAGHVEALCDELRAGGCPAEGLALDLSKPEHVAGLEVALATAHVAGVVNNAGVLDRGNLDEITDAQIAHTLAVNVAGVIQVTREALRHMRPGSRIINVGSISGTLGTAGASLYNASKWAVTGLTKSWAAELKDRDIFVAEVRPGSVDTDMLKQTPFEPVVEPGEVARLVRYLAVEAPITMTGTAVDIFG